MEGSKLKTADSTSGPTSKVSVVKNSVRSDKVKDGFWWARLTNLHKKNSFEKNAKQVSELFSIQINIESLF
jgi:hypothetical protein